MVFNLNNGNMVTLKTSPQKVPAAKKKPIAFTGGLPKFTRIAAGCWEKSEIHTAFENAFSPDARIQSTTSIHNLNPQPQSTITNQQFH